MIETTSFQYVMNVIPTRRKWCFALANSVHKTGRAVIVQEAAISGGLASEIAANIAEKALLSLQAPIARVAGYDTPMPYFKNEQSYMPQVSDIVMAIRETLDFV